VKRKIRVSLYLEDFLWTNNEKLVSVYIVVLKQDLRLSGVDTKRLNKLMKIKSKKCFVQKSINVCTVF